MSEAGDVIRSLADEPRCPFCKQVLDSIQDHVEREATWDYGGIVAIPMPAMHSYTCLPCGCVIDKGQYEELAKLARLD